jgi:hypothetical protein
LCSKVARVEARFKRIGERRYAVELVVPGVGLQSMSPAPGYDDDIPHDLVHYIVEAELQLLAGVFGRAAKGGGTFIREPAPSLTARELARQRRRSKKRESALRARDDTGAREMETSERLAALCDVAWRRRHGQRPDPLRKAPAPVSEEDAVRVARVVTRLDALAPLWRALPVGGALVFQWPSVTPSVAHAP